MTRKFDSFQIDNQNYEEILAKCKELTENVEPTFESYKNELLLNLSFKFVETEFKIAEVFGKLSIKKVTALFYINLLFKLNNKETSIMINFVFLRITVFKTRKFWTKAILKTCLSCANFQKTKNGT